MSQTDPPSVSTGLCGLSRWTNRSELHEHGQVVADRPAFGDTSSRQPVSEGRVPDVGASRSIEPAEPAAGPVMLARAELRHHVVLGDDEVLHPPGAVNITLSRPEELTRPFQARRAAGRKGMIDHVRQAQRIQAAQIATPVAEPIELLHNRFVLRSVQSAIPPRRWPAKYSNQYSNSRPRLPAQHGLNLRSFPASSPASPIGRRTPAG
jgi:hypothetical protein